jgi:hypothetical protein
MEADVLMRKLSPNPPHALSDPRWLRGLDALIDHVGRVLDEHLKHAPKSAPKPLAKTA